MINQEESKKVRIGFWLLKILSRDMKTRTKNKDQLTNSYEKLQKSRRNGKYNTYHGPLSWTWIDERY